LATTRRGGATIPVTLTPIATDRPSPTDPSTVERVGGHIGAALWEALRRAVARVLGRRASGYVDIARTLPLTYAIASVLAVMAALLAYADIVNPVRLPG